MSLRSRREAPPTVGTIAYSLLLSRGVHIGCQSRSGASFLNYCFGSGFGPRLYNELTGNACGVPQDNCVVRHKGTRGAPQVLSKGASLVMPNSPSDEAALCRTLARELSGQPEEPFLLRLSEAFDEVARNGELVRGNVPLRSGPFPTGSSNELTDCRSDLGSSGAKSIPLRS